MSGRFAGSKSLDERRRRRIVADENNQSTDPKAAAPADARPLPTRRPTGRFPLRRIVPRSKLKITLVGIAATTLSGIAVAAGQSVAISRGAYGPGIAALCDTEHGRLATAVAGLLLLFTAQLAWLIRWARSRSLQDFRGGYRVWWWASAASLTAGALLLTDAHLAFAATLAWVTEYRPLNSDVAYQLLPAFAAIVLLVPALQREMRGCVVSRIFFLFAVACWLGFGGALVAASQLDGLLLNLGFHVPTSVAATAGLLTGTSAAFTGLLFHARHVVYETVEPPAQPVRRKKTVKAKVNDESAEDESAESEPSKPKRTSSRRNAKASKAAAVETVAEVAAVETPAAEIPAAKPAVAKPHFASPKPASPSPKAEEPAAHAPAPVKAKPAPVETEPERYGQNNSDDAGEMVEFDGRNVRLDGPEDLRGLSKRERRKLRKAGKEREHSES